METRTFAVDASLLHELGERLIGRPAIALGELVKNAFDADATICRIEFSQDQIIVSDNGVGMSKDDFLNLWMRIGTTHKVDKRVSREFKRPLTGSKGIGRLAAQFLADELMLESARSDRSAESVYATVDWTKAIRGNDLSTVEVKWETRKSSPTFPGDSSSGTRITLSTLKTSWDAETIRDLGNDVWMLRSPFKSAGNVPKRLRRDDFVIEIEAPAIAGARDEFDRTLKAVFGNWKARIRGSLENGRSDGAAVITVDFRAEYPKGAEKAQFRQTVHLPVRPSEGDSTPLLDRASFEILIFRPEGRQPGGVSVGELREYLSKFGNVSVYDAGFRLPYYGSKRDEVGEDWLSIAADQGRRLNQSELLPERLRDNTKYMQDLPAPGRIFGAVEINTNHETRRASKARDKARVHLQIQPGRDRLHDNEAFYQLRDLVRLSLDFYANRFRVRGLDAAEKARATEPTSRKFQRAISILERNRDDIPASVFRAVKREVVDAVKASRAEEGAIDRRAALLAPLAAAGMVALALNHEISRESRFLDRIGTRLNQLARKFSISELAEIAGEFKDARDRLDSLRELFAPLLSDTDKAATDRLKVRAVVQQTADAMRVLMPGVTFQLSGVPADLRFPLGSFAEWSAMLQNILSNSWNALLDSEKRVVKFDGARDERGREWLHVSDSGQGLAVPLAESEKLFEPFERRLSISPDKRSIAIGGQGLGLTIVRMIARRRSARVGFVEPAEGFSTTFEISWRGAK